MRWPADPFFVFHLVSRVTNGTIILPTRQVDKRPVYPRRPCHLASSRHPVGVVFSKLSKLLNQEDALSALCFTR
jgi:hypothetical protein